MIKALPSFAAFLFCTAVSAQCTPNQLYADSVFGVWPDTIQDFDPGFVGSFYSDTLNILTPHNAGDIDPLFSIFTIDSIALNSVTGLPPGLSIVCNSQTGAACTYLPQQVGCGLIQGTPTLAGNYPISLDVIAYAHAPLFGAQELPQVFTGYSINISMGAGVDEMPIATLSHVRNVPNPVTDRTNIEFNLAKAGEVKVKVYDLVGAELWTGQLLGKPGLNRMPFEATKLESGIYLYTVSSAGTSFTGRMVVGR